jgi:hypothetical protein
MGTRQLSRFGNTGMAIRPGEGPDGLGCRDARSYCLQVALMILLYILTKVNLVPETKKFLVLNLVPETNGHRRTSPHVCALFEVPAAFHGVGCDRA